MDLVLFRINHLFFTVELCFSEHSTEMLLLQLSAGFFLDFIIVLFLSYSKAKWILNAVLYKKILRGVIWSFQDNLCHNITILPSWANLCWIHSSCLSHTTSPECSTHGFLSLLFSLEKWGNLQNVTKSLVFAVIGEAVTMQHPSVCRT